MARHQRRTPFAVVLVATFGLMVGFLSPAHSEVLGGLDGSTLGREPLRTPTDAADAAPADLQYADPTSGLAGIDPPEPNSGGGAQLSYPLVLPHGRGLTPDLALDYDSGNGSGWVGQGWSFGVGEVSVDTTFGVPKFCPRTTAPTCGNYESESYRLDGDLLQPGAVTSDPQPRVAEREDYTRKVETEYSRIIRHGDSPKNYFWEVRDKMGNIKWYGGYPDNGGPFGGPGTRTGAARNDLTPAPSAELKDQSGNVVAWYLKGERDVGVNMMRYEYDTVTYQAGTAQDGSGTTWTKVPASDCTGVCAHHVYLSKILYTGAAQASERPEDPGYEVDLVRGRTRSDPVLDASTGVLDLDRDLLTRIQVRAHASGKLLTEYRLDYARGEFGKQLLTSVTQVGCAGAGGCDEGTAATHTFDYYDDADGWGPSTRWTTHDDGLADQVGGIEGRSGALGMSSTIGGDGHLYVGFNPTEPTKLGSFGGALTLEGADTTSLSEFMDINGDSLPDKVFRDPDDTSQIYYRLNEASPSDPLDKQVQFQGGDPVRIENLDTLPAEHEFGVDGGVEAYFGISVLFHAGGSWNWSDGYFSDVNGDGLPDFVKRGSVLFNHLDCPAGGTAPCRPVFGRDDSRTRLPLTIRPTDTQPDDTLADTLATLRRLSPPIDTVRRWVAPYDGTVTIDSTATLVTPTGASANRVAIQRNGSELASDTLTSDGQSWQRTLTGVHVDRGARIYFRFSPDTDSEQSSVDWAPTITYTAYDDPSVGADPPADANGLSQRVFDAKADFTLAGRPGGFVGLPSGGPMRFSGILQKGSTSDDVRPTVTHRLTGGRPERDEAVTVTALAPDGTPDPQRQKSVSTDGQHCVVDGAGRSFGCYASDARAAEQLQVITTHETGLFGISSEFTAEPPVRADGETTDQDLVQARLAVDSPVDATALRWTTLPDLCYLSGGSCDGSKAHVAPPVDTDIYPISSSSAPVRPWRWDTTRTVTATATVTVGDDNGRGDVVLTVKDADGYVAKVPIAVPHDSAGAHSADVSVTLDKDTDYWFALSAADPSLSEKITGTDVSLSWKSGDTTTRQSAPATLYATGRQGYFPVSYRGWGVAGYRGDGNRRTNPVDESKFVLSKPDGSGFDDKDDACQQLNGRDCLTADDVDSLTFPGSYDGSGTPRFDADAAEKQIKEAYAYLPTRTATESGVTEAWTGPKPEHRGTGSGLGAALLGDLIPTVTSGGGDIPAPILSGTGSPTFSLTGGVGPATGSFGFGWSHSDVDFLDLNGDQFPDVVRPGSVTYTDPRGGTACRQASGSYAACTGAGVDTVNSDTTFSFSAGFEGSPVAIKANARGATNSTLGKSAGKGGGAAKDEYGAGIGAGAEVSGSFSSPNSADPAWDDSDFDADLDKIPGDPLGSSGAALQQTLADVNGDGLPDRVRTTPAGVFVRLNLGYGFAPELKWATGGFESGESWSGALSLGLGFAGYNKDYSGGVSRTASVDFPRYSWVDVNGDGILDGLHKSGDHVDVAFGTGVGLSGGDRYGNTQRVDFDIVGDVGAQTGDQIRQGTTIGYGAGADFTIGFGPLCVVACYLIVNPGAHGEGAQSLSDVELTDVNGDGYADSVSRDTSAGDGSINVSLNTQGRTGLLKSVANPLGGSITIDYGRAGNTVDHPGSTWVMKRLSVDDGRPGDGPSVATSRYAYSGLRYDFVDRTDLGFATVTERELGTDGTTVLRSTEQDFDNDSVFDAGLLTSVSLYDGDVAPANLVQRSSSTWKVLDATTGLPIDVTAMSADQRLAAWATPLLSDTEDSWYTRGSSTPGLRSATHYEYDALGNPTTILDKGDPGSPTDDVTATVVYSDCRISAGEELAQSCGTGDPTRHPVFWDDQLCPTWVSTPATVTITDADGKVLRYRDGRESLCDNASVTLLRELVDGSPGDDDSDFAETRLSYDWWGSYNRIIYPADAQGRHYAVYYVYDPVRHSDIADVTDFQLDDSEIDGFLDADPADFPPAAPEHIGLTSHAEFDTDTGQKTRSVDASGNATTYAYDALGRSTRVTMPDGGSVSYAYHPTDPDYAYAVARHSDAFHTGDTIDTVSFVDGLGRTTQQKREADLFDTAGEPSTDAFVVSGAVTYDVLGREVAQAYPTRGAKAAMTTFDTGAPDTPTTANTYDALDRVTRSVAPGDRVTTTDYGFGTVAGLQASTTTVTDPLGRATRTADDVRGHTRAVDDIAVGKPALRTSYDVDPLGQLLSVTAAGRTQAENGYDLLGRRTSTATEDGGTVEYGYDDAGNQVSTQSSVQRADNDSLVRYSYSFGNLVGVDYPDATPDVTLRWGGYDGVPTDGNGAGRLVEVTDAARHQTLEYDANGFQSAEVTEMVDDHWKQGILRTETDHDWLGRVGTITYPDGEVVSNDYDHGGALDSVHGAKPCTDLGALAEAVDATQTTITVSENPLDGDPATPFTIRTGGEQLRVTGRAPAAAAGQWVYTVERGVNGTAAEPTNAAHAAGSSITSDEPAVCAYRYLDQRQYDEFGASVFEQVGNGNRTESTYDPLTRRLRQLRTTAPLLGGRVLQDLQYTYDKVGNVRTYENALPPDTSALMGGPSRQTYDYDGYYRVIRATGRWEQAPHTLRHYTYDVGYDDATGNVVARSQRDWETSSDCKKRCKEFELADTTFNLGPVGYASDHQHQADAMGRGASGSTLTHDLDGNVTSIRTPDFLREMSWDGNGRLTMVVDRPNGTGGKPTYYAYDWQGRRAFEHKEQGRSWFVNPYVTVKDGTTWKNYYAGDQMLATKFAQDDAYEHKVYFSHRDLQGSTNIVTDRTGNVFQHHEYFPGGQVWVDEKSTIFRTPYQFSGHYFDEDHGISDLGQRWYDTRRGLFYSVEPAVFSDPASLVDQPALAAAYTYAWSNPLSFTDPDGALPRGVTQARLRTLEAGLRDSDDAPLSLEQRIRLQQFFRDNSGLRGRLAFSVLSHLEGARKLQAFSEKFEMKPLVEISIGQTDSGWKLQNVKLSWGYHKRAKLNFGSESPGSTSTPPPMATNPPAPPPPPPAGWRPARVAAASTSPPVTTGSATTSSTGGP